MNIGFIGAGHMGSAMIEGLLKANTVAPENLFVKGGSSGTAEALQEKLGFRLIKDYTSLKECQVIFIATGAKIVLEILKQAAPFMAKNTILISVATGHTVEEAQAVLGEEIHVVHAIPNTPVSVNAGMIGAVFANDMPGALKADALNVLESLGKVKEVNEHILGTFGTVAGCSPAFVDIFMEALADGAVSQGMPRALSYEVIAQMMLGSATLALETQKHPGELKDGVTSPGGSTIKGVAALEKNGFRYAVIDAVNQANS
ncbi:pyrroline-5-carboxylate reductase [Enterococcus ureilyticus]|uniref:Pyrroline-5-carboxylate reductase n=1 Tax=Enterococcus ureilyticus TaxID=1131292 RepID=A0A1E5HAF8_9ENTE|nr:pyrroline-5-carboxylate reductase [Enterococcus ureilyticus]MBM7688264.1 pyrroline-5-carboxylate reductase [Enterococcus ureilyticus]MBO0447778.1 pyrroline-5-carboxylate reductase [Enterococcus ureilyticus]OEG21796.1 pyrroline-5-carboxylate reductase [Enterococcus ureilyticus]